MNPNFKIVQFSLKLYISHIQTCDVFQKSLLITLSKLVWISKVPKVPTWPIIFSRNNKKYIVCGLCWLNRSKVADFLLVLNTFYPVNIEIFKNYYFNSLKSTNFNFSVRIVGWLIGQSAIRVIIPMTDGQTLANELKNILGIWERD